MSSSQAQIAFELGNATNPLHMVHVYTHQADDFSYTIRPAARSPLNAKTHGEQIIPDRVLSLCVRLFSNLVINFGV